MLESFPDFELRSAASQIESAVTTLRWPARKTVPTLITGSQCPQRIALTMCTLSQLFADSIRELAPSDSEYVHKRSAESCILLVSIARATSI